MKKILSLLICCIPFIVGRAATYYFSDSQGDDTRSATQAKNSTTPWKTLDKIIASYSTFADGDTVLFKRGDTFIGGDITIGSKGLHFDAYGTGARPIITSFITASGWTAVPGQSGVYESSALSSITSSAVNMVTINNTLYAMGRYPNEDASDGGYLNFESQTSTSLTDAQLGTTILDNTFAGAMLVTRTTHGTLERKTITSISGTTINFNSAFTDIPINGYGYFVQNTQKALDQFGEWYYNTSTKKLSVYFGANTPANYVVQVAAKDTLFTIHYHNVTFNNLCFTGSNSASIMCDWSGILNPSIKNCTFNWSGFDAVRLLGCANAIIDSNTILNSNVNAINLYFGDSIPKVRYNYILNTGMHSGMIQKDVSNQCGAAIYSNQQATVKFNTILNCGYSGIRTDGNDYLVYGNTVDSACSRLDDNGPWYTWVGVTNGTKSNRIVRRNVFTNAGWGAQYGTTESLQLGYCFGGGGYFDDNANNVTYDSNTVANCNMAGIYIHNARDLTITNNTFFNNALQYSSQHDLAGNITNLVVKKNQFFSTNTTQLILRLASSNNDFGSIGTFDSNSYCRPANESNIISRVWFGNSTTNFSLAGWQGAGYGYDTHTHITPVPVTNNYNIMFHVAGSQGFPLAFSCVLLYTANGVEYTNGYTVAPYSSVIFVKQ